MKKFKAGQIVLMCSSLLVWAIWAIFAVVKRDVIIASSDTGTEFEMLLIWSVLVYILMIYPIFSPDMNLVSKKINKYNLTKILNIRRTNFAAIQFLFVFVACGTSVSLFYPTWKIGIGVTIAIYAASMLVLISVYGYRFKKLAKNQPDIDTDFDAEHDVASV